MYIYNFPVVITRQQNEQSLTCNFSLWVQCPKLHAAKLQHYASKLTLANMIQRQSSAGL